MPPLTPGNTLGPYEIVKLLGTGGMGEVYLARDKRLDRLVAIKTLLPHPAHEQEFRRRFEREARAVSSLNHPNICTLYDVGDIDGAAFIVMEYLGGETLAERIAAGPIAAATLLEYALQLSDALQLAHSRGVIHRDIKPANIFVVGSAVKILDFGLAKIQPLAEADTPKGEWPTQLATTVSTPGMMVGTIAYMSPEQARGEELNACTDLFSLGVVFYEAATGSRPFNGSTAAVVLHQLLGMQPPPPDLLSPGLPAPLARIIMRCLEKIRSSRFASATELREELLDFKRTLESGISLVPRPAVQNKISESIAVLPFRNVGADPDNDYFSDGLAEDLIGTLGQIEGLNVMSRSTAFAFKGKEVDVREIGRRLNVNAILEGSIRRIGDRIRVTAQLVKTTDGYHLWSEKYDCRIEDEFAIQDEIARKIADSLRLRLASGTGGARRHTADHEAYHLYLKGRYHWNKMTAESYHKGLQCAQEAIAKDPNYALAYTGLADAYSVLALNGVLAPRQLFLQSKALALRALELDEGLPEAHISVGIVRFWYDWDWEGAETAFRRGLQLNPNLAFGSGSYSWLLISLGRFDEAIAQLEFARIAAPLDVTLYMDMAYAHRFAGRRDAAQQEFRGALEIDPSFAEALNGLGMVYSSMQQYAEAREVTEKAANLSPQSPRFLGHLGYVCAKMGDRERALEILRQLEQQALQGYVAHVPIAWIYLALGELQKALECLWIGYNERDGMMVALNAEPEMYEPIRSEPRFIELIQAMKFPPRPNS